MSVRSPKLHIGINAQLLSFSGNYRNGGISRSIRGLLAGLAKDPGPHEYTVFVNGQDTIDRLGLGSPQITYVAAPWNEARPISRITWEQLTLPSTVRKMGMDVLHSPANVLPEMLPSTCAGVVTLHDLAFLHFPKVLTPAKRIYHRTFTVRSLRRATMIIAVSDSTKQDATQLVGVPAEHIRRVYTCMDERFSRLISDEESIAFRVKQGLPQGFLLYLGTLEPRKNITILLEAYARLRKNYPIKEKLVLAGGKGWYYEEIFERVRNLGLESEVIFPGYVSDADQPLWYHAASAFVYPSLYEGFGLPVAEALACGTPVVTSDVSSLPEAGAGLALCVAPDDIQAMAEAMYKAITDAELRRRCVNQAPQILKRFSAQRMAAETIGAYEQAAARRVTKMSAGELALERRS